MGKADVVVSGDGLFRSDGFAFSVVPGAPVLGDLGDEVQAAAAFVFGVS
ncbi:hypothetical protein ACFVXE_19465 [Streptomyces sp. NPDC058231]